MSESVWLAWTEAVLVVWCVAGCLIAMVSVYRRKYSDARWVARASAALGPGFQSSADESKGINHARRIRSMHFNRFDLPLSVWWPTHGTGSPKG